MFTPVLKLPENTKGRDFFVGDIHGAFSLLDKALAEVKFDPACDRLISIGDLTDRGPDNIRCLEFLKQPWFFAIRGNHEDMFLRTVTPEGYLDIKLMSDPKFVENQIRNGCDWVYDESFATRVEIREAFKKLPLAIELETKEGKIGFVHADVPSTMGWEKFKQKLEEGNHRVVTTCLWGRNRLKHNRDSGVKGLARIYFGHTVQSYGATQLGNCFYIDTGAVFSLDARVKEHCCLTLGEVTAAPEDITRMHYEKPVSQIYTVTKTPPTPALPAARNTPKPFRPF